MINKIIVSTKIILLKGDEFQYDHQLHQKLNSTLN